MNTLSTYIDVDTNYEELGSPIRELIATAVVDSSLQSIEL
jgi:hypothetical protein